MFLQGLGELRMGMWFLLLNILCEQSVNESEVCLVFMVAHLFIGFLKTRRYSVLQDEEKTLIGNDRGGVRIMTSQHPPPPKEVLLRVCKVLIFTFMHWRRKWQPTPVLLPGESQGRGSLEGCRLWGRTESDTTKVTQQQQQQHYHDERGCCCLVAQSCQTLCDPMGCSPPGSSVHGISQARVLE